MKRLVKATIGELTLSSMSGHIEDYAQTVF